MSVAPNGLHALTGHADGTVRLWTLTTGERLWSGHKHEGPVLSVCFAPDGKQALSGGTDKAIVLWDAAKGEFVRRFHNNAHVSEVWLVRFLADLTPTSTSADKRVLWDPKTGLEKRTGGRSDIIAGKVGQKTQTFPGERLIPESKVPTDDGLYLLAGFGGDVLTVYRGPTRLASLPGHGEIKVMALSADGKRALTVGEDGQLRLWDVRGQKLVPGSPWPPGGAATSVGLTPDGSRALVGLADGSLNVWKLPQ